MTFYNDNEPFVAEWLKNLIAAGQISNGVVDGRPIQQLRMDELVHYGRMHFFAGIGGWDLALRWAGWPPDRPVWTGSCPCQPFSVAGKRQGIADKRHLWPEWFRLIKECHPPTIFGEQVASADGRTWLAGVFADLEELGYAVAGADLCAAGVGAPHIRQRLWWVAHSQSSAARAGYALCPRQSNAGDGGDNGRVAHPGCVGSPRWGAAGVVAGAERNTEGAKEERQRLRDSADDGSSDGGVAHSSSPELCRVAPAGDECWYGQNGPVIGWLDHTTEPRCPRSAKSGAPVEARDEARLPESGGRGGLGRLAHPQHTERRAELEIDGHTHGRDGSGGCSHPGGLGHPDHTRPQGRSLDAGEHTGQLAAWTPSVFIGCADGKARRTQPGLQPLAHGIPARVGKLRAYGNAIVPQVAATFIRAFLETEHD